MVTVIIENQMEETDHSHLGQILTYVVGATAKTVIWISPDPRPEYVASVEWLNEITPVDMKLKNIHKFHETNLN
ncbi:hypothetical protein [Desulfosporosinus sp. BICA1-9]|uniref:hypothetical protein n=1 Tax=Desulfosporosinus sp. BICA1-9 TaxID=1531958 RepID=UPI00054BF176|nr:hypothetical protein [Desulfosporosinus sp. BICA1-9]KJS46898.1 MAG: hypothetical protein VR66_22730 [Peptococcaceae bacterium BRH_c23]KJS89966.1 MAG: hypothetical protein JL57_04305 [Desulfosporosinus sp. BICA1-9]HBW37892.1 hypothetical protein [Desulfosporosinus sp.]